MFTTPQKPLSSHSEQPNLNYLSPLQGIQGIFRAAVGSPSTPHPVSPPSMNGPGCASSPLSPTSEFANAFTKKVAKRKRCIPTTEGCDCSIQKIDPDAKSTPKTRPIIESRAKDMSSPVSPSPMAPPLFFPQRDSSDRDAEVNPTPSKRARMTQAFRTPARPTRQTNTPRMGSRDPPADYTAFPHWATRPTPLKVDKHQVKAEKTRVKKRDGLRKERKQNTDELEVKVKVEDTDMDTLPIPSTSKTSPFDSSTSPRKSPLSPTLPKSTRRPWIPMDRDEELEMNFTNLAEDVKRAFGGLGVSNASPSKPSSSRTSNSRSTSSSTDSTPAFTRTSSSSSNQSSGPSTPISHPIDVEIIDEDSIFQRHFLNLSKNHVRTTRLVDPERAERVLKVVDTDADMPPCVKVNVEGASERMLTLQEMLRKEREWSAAVMERNLSNGPHVRPTIADTHMEENKFVEAEMSEDEEVKIDDTGIHQASEEETEAQKVEEEEAERQRQAELEEIRRVNCARVREEAERQQKEQAARDAEKLEAALKEKTRLRREREERERRQAEADAQVKAEAEFLRKQHLERERLREERRGHQERLESQRRQEEHDRIQDEQRQQRQYQEHLEAERLARIEAEAHARILAAEAERLQRLAEAEQARRLATEEAYRQRMAEEETLRRLREEEHMMRRIREEAERAAWAEASTSGRKNMSAEDVQMRDASFYVPPKQQFHQQHDQPRRQRSNRWCDVDASMASIPADIPEEMPEDVDVEFEDLSSGSGSDSGYGSMFDSQSQSSSTSPATEYESSSSSSSVPPQPDYRHVPDMEPEVEEEPQPYNPPFIPNTTEDWFEQYEERWRELTALVTSSTHVPSSKITFSHIPWPTFSHPTSLASLSESNIREFFMVRYPRNEPLDKKMWNKDLNRWHTDKVGRVAGLLWEGAEGSLRQDVHEGFSRCIKVMVGLKEGRM